MAHTYAHLPPNTEHACARLTLVCAHASNHGCGVDEHGGAHGIVGINERVRWTIKPYECTAQTQMHQCFECYKDR